MQKIEIDSIIRSHRKTISLEISGDAKLTVRAPRRATLDEIHDLVNRKRSWIVRTRQRVQERRRAYQPKRFSEGENFIFLGKAYPLSIRTDAPSPLIFRDNSFILKKESAGEAKALFIGWYKKQARTIIEQKVRLFARHGGVCFSKIRITNAEKRWGSCSQKGNLNFSWRLVLAPIDIIDYVVLHELSHLKEQNHSKKFWDAVASVCPEYRKRRKWLKENGHTLSL